MEMCANIRTCPQSIKTKQQYTRQVREEKKRSLNWKQPTLKGAKTVINWMPMNSTAAKNGPNSRKNEQHLEQSKLMKMNGKTSETNRDGRAIKRDRERERESKRGSEKRVATCKCMNTRRKWRWKWRVRNNCCRNVDRYWHDDCGLFLYVCG